MTTSKLAWLKFIALIMPELRELALKLYQRHSGDVDAVKAELRYIGDYGEQLRNFESEISKRMAALKEKSAEREAARPPKEDKP